MRFLIGRTDAIGDVIVSLPIMARILERDPGSEVHWLLRPYTAELLEGVPGCTQVHLRTENQNLEALFRHIQPDAVLNLNHRDAEVTLAARRAGVNVRVARPRGLGQILAATHRLWRGRSHSGRHEVMNVLDFLFPWGWNDGLAPLPHLNLTEWEQAEGEVDLAAIPRPRLGVATRSSGSSAYPSPAWWSRTLPGLENAGWHLVILAPPEDSSLPAGTLRRMLARIKACDAFLGPSTGPTQAAAALGVPTLALMGLSTKRGASRWGPRGKAVETLCYPGQEADFTGGMDRLPVSALVERLDLLK